MHTHILEGGGGGGVHLTRDVTYYGQQPLTSDLMHALIDRSDLRLSPRVVREAEELLHDCFTVGVRAWQYMRSHEQELHKRRKYDTHKTFLSHHHHQYSPDLILDPTSPHS